MKDNKKHILIAPSILSADFSKLGEEIRGVEEAGADWIHIDVMDGGFVPNITIGAPVVRSIRPHSSLVFDVHLMINSPEKYLDDFVSAGSDIVTFHFEACDDPVGLAERIRSNGKKAGMSIKPGTSPDKIEGVLGALDMVLVMTVEPGFGGQSFMPDMMEKVKWIKERFKGLVQIDGGVNAETSRTAISAGVDVLVAGTAVFGKNDYARAIKDLRGD